MINPKIQLILQIRLLCFCKLMLFLTTKIPFLIIKRMQPDGLY